jgi:hypothetical protein
VSDVSQGPGWWQASDGRWYPPQATAAPPPPAPGPPQAPGPPPGPPPAPQWGGPPPAKKSNRGCFIALAVVGVLALLGIVATVVIISAVGNEVDDRVNNDGGVTNFSGNDENPPADDVTVAECGPAPNTEFMRATLDVLNHSSEPSNYIVTVAFESEDGNEQLATSTALVNGLGPDQTTNTEADSFQRAPGGQEFSCRITQVERFAA